MMKTRDESKHADMVEKCMYTQTETIKLFDEEGFRPAAPTDGK